jgi:hypothetical protein
MLPQPDAAFRERVARLAGATPVAWVRRTGGYSPAERWVATLPDGSTVFAKAGVSALTSDWLRREFAVYEALRARFMPSVLAYEDDPVSPLMLFEDLTYAHWPPPWSFRNVESVREALADLAGMHAPPFLHPASEGIFITGKCWAEVARDPQPFLSLGIVNEGWLDAALPVLLAAESAAKIDGDSVLHMDVRSDNLCFADEDEPVLIDWNHAARGAAELDVAFWLPSLQFEGGPAPETILPDAPEYAALISGFFAARAGQPIIEDAPFVRRVQREQLSTSLPWAVRELALPPLKS